MAAWRDPALPQCTLLAAPRTEAGGECGRQLKVRNKARRAAYIGVLDESGGDTRARVVPPSVTMLVPVCTRQVWRARDAAGRVLGEHQVTGAGASLRWDLRECAGRHSDLVAGRSRADFGAAFAGGSFSLQMGSLSRRGGTRGGSITFVLKAQLKHLWEPRHETLRWGKEAVCPVCGGRGAAEGHVATCPHCGGEGHEHNAVDLSGRVCLRNHSQCAAAAGQGSAPHRGGFSQRLRARCPLCDGFGHVPDPDHVCKACKGLRMVRRNQGAQVTVPAGAPSDWTAVFEGRGHEAVGGTPGDVVVKLEVEAHDNFTRPAPDSPDLETTLTVSLKEALLGFARNVTHPLGHNVTVSREGITTPGDEEVVGGEGLPVVSEESGGGAPEAFGDLIVRLDVEFPKSIGKGQRESLLDLRMH